MSASDLAEIHHPVVAARKSIVMVDDEEAILHALKSLFRRETWSLRLFSSPKLALEDLRNAPADIIVSDLRMSEMSGIELLNQAASICPEAVRFMLSGHEDRGVVIAALAKNLAQHYVMKPWDDEGFRKLLHDTLKIQADVKDQQMTRLLASFDRLPTLPVYYEKLRQLLGKNNYSMNEVVSEIQKSPALVARLLRVSNSIYYATRRPVLTVRDAVVFIGTDYVANLIMAMETFQAVLETGEDVPEQLVEMLWNRSLQRAIIAQKIANHGPWRVDSQLVYVVALLQDIGLVVRLCSEPTKYQRVVELERAGKVSLYEADQVIFGTPHDVLGAALLTSWNLPTEIVSAIAEHHAQSSTSDLVKVVQLSDLLVTGGRPSPHDPAVELHMQESKRIISN
jgi:HD-like signal output (HDOD) protein